MGASETSNEGNELMSDRTVPYTYGNVILTGEWYISLFLA